ncbi:unnamed protein product [Caenorhabditis angaria]|uniref:Uncharacterized protein n=1 Tax=Caenorhabditis angaria TaxID=860376 RepID=A0A9P1N795_9PELO|nr:unnamed protein product [Caenorhabditis angaria]
MIENSGEENQFLNRENVPPPTISIYWNNFLNYLAKNRWWKTAFEVIYRLLVTFLIATFFYYLNQFNTIRKFDEIPCQRKFAIKFKPDNFITIPEYQDELEKFRGALILLQIAPLINRYPTINKSAEFCKLFSHLCTKFEDYGVPAKTDHLKIDLPNSYHPKYLNFLEVCDPVRTIVVNTTGKSYKYFDSINITRYLRPTLKQEQNIDLQFDPNDSTKSITCVHIEGSSTLGANSATISKILASKILPEDPDIIYFLSTNGLWRYLRDNLHENWPHQQYRDIQISDQLETIFFAKKFCDQVFLTSPKSEVGWWIGYVSRNVHYLSKFNNSTHIIDGLTEADVYPENWIKL